MTMRHQILLFGCCLLVVLTMSMVGCEPARSAQASAPMASSDVVQSDAVFAAQAAAEATDMWPDRSSQFRSFNPTNGCDVLVKAKSSYRGSAGVDYRWHEYSVDSNDDSLLTIEVYELTHRSGTNQKVNGVKVAYVFDAPGGTSIHKADATPRTSPAAASFVLTVPLNRPRAPHELPCSFVGNWDAKPSGFKCYADPVPAGRYYRHPEMTMERAGSRLYLHIAYQFSMLRIEIK
ncbi:MAG: hypothetical protein AAF432_08810 [Planctomycetota bacterium]